MKRITTLASIGVLLGRLAGGVLLGGLAGGVLLGGLASCDPNAKASEREAPAPKGSLSGPYESCGSTLDCRTGHLCTDQVCRPKERVVIGDFHAARGWVAFGAKDKKTAVEAFAEAVNQYKAAGKEPPVDLFCAQGHVLTASRKNAEYAELAARVLHRCVNGTPTGGSLHERALRDLALLVESGLDPLAIAHPKPADMYMTKGPKRPSSDAVKVTVTSDVRKKSTSHDAMVSQLEGMRDQFLPCWTKYSEGSGNDAMAVTFRLKHRFVEGRFESQDGYKLAISSDTRPPSDAALAVGHACVRAVLEPFVKGFKGGSGSWSGHVTIKLAP